MSKKSKKVTKSIVKSVRKAVKRHSIATGVLTGAATAVALSSTGATKRMSEAVGTGMASLMKAGSKRTEVLRGLKERTGNALVRAGRSLQPAKQTTDGKVTTTTRRSAVTRPATS
ncbi:hypothetical protein BH20VER2_BH20VER2_16980 [soil metagenome]